MADFVPRTCDVSGKRSDSCLATHWIAARVLEYDMAREVSFGELMPFDVYVSEEAIREEIRKRENRPPTLVILVTIGLSVLGSNLLVLSIREGELAATAIIVGLMVVGAVFFVRWWRLRQASLDKSPGTPDVSEIDRDAMDAIGYQIAQAVAWKKARKAGRDKLWTEEQFKADFQIE